MSDNKISSIGSNPKSSLLWMQVKKGAPQMKCIDGLLRPNEYPEKGKKVLLGDVASTLLRISGPHDNVEFSSPPTFDEQKWTLELTSSELSITIESMPYWGFGFFSNCYINKVELNGSLIKRSKIIFDLVVGLGRNPWEPVFPFFWNRITKSNSKTHQEKWLELINFAKKSMEEEIEEINERFVGVKKRANEPKYFPRNWNKENSDKMLSEVVKHINIAKKALHDQNAAALKRSLDRAEAKLIEADPLVGMQNEEILKTQNSEVLNIDEIPFIDLVNEEE
ncbi:MAG: hypothetical protein CMB64_01400 [Euryarchaeota archaeon]|nr:hypothetical protein [Euryarchaeota archaeon]